MTTNMKTFRFRCTSTPLSRTRSTTRTSSRGFHSFVARVPVSLAGWKRVKKSGKEHRGLWYSTQSGVEPHAALSRLHRLILDAGQSISGVYLCTAADISCRQWALLGQPLRRYSHHLHKPFLIRSLPSSWQPHAHQDHRCRNSIYPPLTTPPRPRAQPLPPLLRCSGNRLGPLRAGRHERTYQQDSETASPRGRWL